MHLGGWPRRLAPRALAGNRALHGAGKRRRPDSARHPCSRPPSSRRWSPGSIGNVGTSSGWPACSARWSGLGPAADARARRRWLDRPALARGGPRRTRSLTAEPSSKRLQPCRRATRSCCWICGQRAEPAGLLDMLGLAVSLGAQGQDAARVHACRPVLGGPEGGARGDAAPDQPRRAARPAASQRAAVRRGAGRSGERPTGPAHRSRPGPSPPRLLSRLIEAVTAHPDLELWVAMRSAGATPPRSLNGAGSAWCPRRCCRSRSTCASSASRQFDRTRNARREARRAGSDRADGQSRGLVAGLRSETTAPGRPGAVTGAGKMALAEGAAAAAGLADGAGRVGRGSNVRAAVYEPSVSTSPCSRHVRPSRPARAEEIKARRPRRDLADPPGAARHDSSAEGAGKRPVRRCPHSQVQMLSPQRRRYRLTPAAASVTFLTIAHFAADRSPCADLTPLCRHAIHAMGSGAPARSGRKQA